MFPNIVGVMAEKQGRVPLIQESENKQTVQPDTDYNELAIGILAPPLP